MAGSVWYQGTQFEPARSIGFNCFGIPHSALIYPCDGQFALQSYEGGKRGTGSFHHRQVVALRVHFQEGALEPEFCLPFRQFRGEGRADYRHFPRHHIHLPEYLRLIFRRLVQRTECRSGHDVENGRSGLSVQRNGLDMPVSHPGRLDLQLHGNLGDRLKGNDWASKSDLIAQQVGVLPGVGANIEHAIHVEMAEKSAQMHPFRRPVYLIRWHHHITRQALDPVRNMALDGNHGRYCSSGCQCGRAVFEPTPRAENDSMSAMRKRRKNRLK